MWCTCIGELNIFAYTLYIILFVSEGLVIPSSCNASMQGELTSHLSSSWMYIVYIYIYILIVWFIFAPLLMNWQKRGEVFGEFIYACLFYFLVYTKRKKNLVSLCIYILFSLCISLNIFYVYWYTWVKGELLWSLTLIHAYIIPWVLSSSKRGRLLAQRPITLVLMMINSCSYSTNDLVFN